MQRSSIIITYLILWTKFSLNGARMVKFEFGGEKNRVLQKLRNEETGFLFCW